MYLFATFLMSVAIVTLLVIAIELLSAPEGYEDDQGFHFGSLHP